MNGLKISALCIAACVMAFVDATSVVGQYHHGAKFGSAMHGLGSAGPLGNINRYHRFMGAFYSDGYHRCSPGPDVSYYNPYSAHNSPLYGRSFGASHGTDELGYQYRPVQVYGDSNVHRSSNGFAWPGQTQGGHGIAPGIGAPGIGAPGIGSPVTGVPNYQPSIQPQNFRPMNNSVPGKTAPKANVPNNTLPNTNEFYRQRPPQPYRPAPQQSPNLNRIPRPNDLTAIPMHSQQRKNEQLAVPSVLTRANNQNSGQSNVNAFDLDTVLDID